MEQNKIDEDINQVVNKVQQGDKQAYASIIERFQKPIFLYCYYTLHNQQEAEDTAQETFLKAYKHISTFTPTYSFSAWLYKIAQNACIDALKKRKKDSKMLSAYRDKHIEETKLSDIDLVHDYLDKLTKEEKQIVLLRSLEEYSYEEIAFIMNLKPATIRKKHERLRKKLIKEKKRGVNTYEHSF
ncbi:RNA polymerase sigma factor [Paenibacillus sp. Z6-24]